MTSYIIVATFQSREKDRLIAVEETIDAWLTPEFASYHLLSPDHRWYQTALLAIAFTISFFYKLCSHLLSPDHCLMVYCHSCRRALLAIA